MIYDLAIEQLEAELQMLEAILDDRGDAAHAAAVELANKVKEVTLARFIREESDPSYIRGRINNIRWTAIHVGEAEANAKFRRLRVSLDDIGQRIEQRYINVGYKVTHSGGGPKPGANLSRNVEMAREFLAKKPMSRKSDSALMADIGKSRNLSRSQSIEAIKAGLEKLSG